MEFVPSQIVMANRTSPATLEQVTLIAQYLVYLQKQISDLIARIPEPRPAFLYQGAQRSLDTDFVISTTRNALAVYNVELSVTGSLLVSSSHAEIVANVDGFPFGNHVLDLTSALTLGLSITPKVRKPLVAYVPAGSTVNLTSTTSGGGTVTLVNSQEILL